MITYRFLYNLLGNRKNERIALKAWATWLGEEKKVLAQKIGPELGPDFERKLAEHMYAYALTLALGKDAGPYRNRKSLIKAVQKRYLEHLEQSTPVKKPEPVRHSIFDKPTDPCARFTAVLEKLLANKRQSLGARGNAYNVTEAAKNAGISHWQVYHWMRGGTLPRASKAADLRALEEELGAEHGTLTAFLPYSYKRPTKATRGGTGKAKFTYRQTAFAAHNQQVQALRYFVSCETLPQPIRDLIELYQRWHQDDMSPEGLGRKDIWLTAKANWLWNTNVKGECGALTVWRRFMGEFFGFLQLPTEMSEETAAELRAKGWKESDVDWARTVHVGKGLKAEELRITMLADPLYVMAFSRFQAARTLDEKFGRTQERHVSSAAYLCERKYGFFWQLADRLVAQDLHHFGPDITEGAALRAKAEALHLELQDEAERIRGKATQKRNLDSDLEEILHWESPGKVFYTLLDQLKEEAVALQNNTLLDQARHWQDIILLVALFSVPLRIINWSAVTVDLHLKWQGGKLILTIPLREFKNSTYLKNDYVVEIAPTFAPYFEAYLKWWRPLLPGTKNGSNFLFPPTVSRHMSSSNTDDHSASTYHEVAQDSLSARMRDITKRVLKLSLGAHWIRHVVVTDYLIAHPGDYIHVATILNDSLSTVLRVYKRAMETRSQFKSYSTHLESLGTSAPKGKAESEWTTDELMASLIRIQDALSARGLPIRFGS